ncbi:MAG: hypothetical protein AAGF15_10190 [Pseudomonadota bacterium]
MSINSGHSVRQIMQRNVMRVGLFLAGLFGFMMIAGAVEARESDEAIAIGDLQLISYLPPKEAGSQTVGDVLRQVANQSRIEPGRLRNRDLLPYKLQGAAPGGYLPNDFTTEITNANILNSNVARFLTRRVP